jgi:putative acyl-CoA dehydrogenase
MTAALQDYNLYTSDRVLTEALQRECAGWAEPRIKDFGRRMGSEEAIRWGFQANENPPKLRTHDRFGERVDEVEFHPAYHDLLRTSIESGIHNLPWAQPAKGAHAARAALMMLASQNEQGHVCPVSMTYAAVPTLRQQPELAKAWEPLLRSQIYDPRFRPAGEKLGVLIGMAMTEKQDPTITTATPDAEGYRITGNKWFCSAPMSDAFLVPAQAPDGPAGFLLPRWHDAKRNGFRLQRLKDKLGNRSNATVEVEFDRAWAWRVPSITETVQHRRLDCVLGSAAVMRQALVQAIHHCTERDRPLMQNVLADLALESEAATVAAMRLARAFDGERSFARLATAVMKYWICKRAPLVVNECIECLGGNGYVEESGLPRLYREAPLNSIWEGSGNAIALDIQRAIRNEPDSLEALLAELDLARGSDERLDAIVDSFQIEARFPNEVDARRLAENLALALQASLLIRHSPEFVWRTFCATRLDDRGGRTFGTLPSTVARRKIVDRAFA